MAVKWGGMARQSQVGHLLSSNELADRVTQSEVRLRISSIAKSTPHQHTAASPYYCYPHSRGAVVLDYQITCLTLLSTSIQVFSQTDVSISVVPKLIQLQVHKSSD